MADTAKVSALIGLWEKYVFSSPDTALGFAKEALKLSEVTGYDKGIGLALNKIGYVYERKSNAAEALAYQRQALPYLEASGDKDAIAWCLHNTGNAYSLRGDYAEALKWHFRALKLREEIQTKRGIGYSYTAIALIYQRQGNTAEELQYQEKAVPLLTSVNDKEGVARSMASIAAIYGKRGDTLRAERYLDTAVTMARNVPNKMALVFALTAGGEFLSNQKQFEKSVQTYSELLEVSKKLGNKFIVAGTLKRLAEVYFKQGKLTESMSYANESIALAQTIDAKVHLRDNYRTLSTIYASRKDYAKAYQYYAKYVVQKDSLASSEIQNNIAKMQSRYEAEKKDQEISVLKVETERDDAIQRSLIGGAVGLGALLIVSFFALRLKLRQNKNLKKLNEMLDAARKKAEDASNFKTRLLGIAAHDLKNPLQSIFGFALLIEERAKEMLSGNDDDDRTEIMDMSGSISRVSERMRKLIDDLLESSAIDSGIVLHKHRVDVSDVVRSSMVANQAQAVAKEQTIHFIIEPHVNLTVEIDVERMQQVFDNLISNAVKYSPAKKHISIKVELADGRSPNNTPLSHKAVFVSIKDDGLGLSDEDKKKLFGKFQKLSARPTGGESSTGLGLSIVKQLVELHGGAVWAESEGKNKGTTFFVMLPAAPVTELVTTAASPDV
jgi:signal transduction histidine kinase